MTLCTHALRNIYTYFACSHERKCRCHLGAFNYYLKYAYVYVCVGICFRQFFIGLTCHLADSSRPKLAMMWISVSVCVYMCLCVVYTCSHRLTLVTNYGIPLAKYRHYSRQSQFLHIQFAIFIQTSNFMAVKCEFYINDSARMRITTICFWHNDQSGRTLLNLNNFNFSVKKPFTFKEKQLINWNL